MRRWWFRRGVPFRLTVRWLEDSGHQPLPVRMVAAVRRALQETEGDILAFLPGAGEIRACAEQLRQTSNSSSLTIHPLYGDLPFAEQQKAILPGPVRKVVLATNIAETSLTIEGVRTVIDSGLSRTLRHDLGSGMNRLLTVRESRASAEQRAGRAGRLAPGVCYRLFGPHTFNAMTGFPPAGDSGLRSLFAGPGAGCLGGAGPGNPVLARCRPPRQRLLPAGNCSAAWARWTGTGEPPKPGEGWRNSPSIRELPGCCSGDSELGAVGPASLLGALLAERDIFHYRPGDSASLCESDLLERYEAVADRRQRGDGRVQAAAVRAVERSAAQLLRLMGDGAGEIHEATLRPDDAARLLLAAYPDRVARQREEGSDRYLLANGRGVRLSRKSGVRNRAFLLALQVDAGEKRRDSSIRPVP